MGGGTSSSLVSSLETAGAFLGAGIAAGTGNEGAAAVLGSAAFGLAAGGQKGCNKSRDAIIQSTNEIVATAIVLSVNNCGDLAEVSQEIEITCDPRVAEGTVYEQNSSCQACYTGVFDGMLAQHALERKVWADGGAVFVRTPIDEEYQLLLNRVQSCGINTCKACALSNVTQANIIQQNTNCENILRDSEQFQTNLTSLIQEQLLNNQDVLSGAAQALGAQGVNQITEQVSNQITSNVNQEFLDNVVNRISQSQVIRINSNTSTTFNNVTQLSAFNIALEEVTTNNIVLRSINLEVFDTIAEIANEQNTLNDVGEVVFQATIDFSSAINNVVGQVMIAVLIGLGVVVAFIVGYALYRFIKRTSVKQEKLQKQVQMSRANLPALQQF